MNTLSFIRIEDGGEVVSMVLHRPPLNIMNIDMMKEMNLALEKLRKHAGAKVLIIKAEGKAFSAGVDIADHASERVGEMMNQFHRLFELLDGFKIPVVAVVDGAALGGGCELAIFCDMIVASSRSKFGQPEITVGVFPPVAAVIFPRLAGRNRALELLLGGETISAEQAERLGMINRVFPVEGFEQSVHEFVSRITKHSKVILELTKRALDSGLKHHVMEAMKLAEELYMNEMMKTEDTAEGLRAFMEKRQPVWKNR
jgi:cyclohexa-1,5-dienecarbonyl-CoA hydratase